jgi:hypothetical protein
MPTGEFFLLFFLFYPINASIRLKTAFRSFYLFGLVYFFLESNFLLGGLYSKGFYYYLFVISAGILREKPVRGDSNLVVGRPTDFFLFRTLLGNSEPNIDFEPTSAKFV